MFRIGKSNHHVRPGDTVWTDRMVAHFSGPGVMPVVMAEPVSGRVRADGTVLLADGATLVPLDNCRLCEKVIRL